MSCCTSPKTRVAIACGGTGGHLFPGLAVAEQLQRRDCEVTLFLSTKEIDRQAAAGVVGMEVVRLPAVGLTPGRVLHFLKGFVSAYRVARRQFRAQPPRAALAMGGFTSAPPMLAAKSAGAKAFLHESNAIPGRANRWLSWKIDQAFVGFSQSAARLHTRRFTVTGTPVRSEFRPADPARCRAELGLDPKRPMVLVMGGSQGASGINELVLRTLGLAKQQQPDWQWFHLAGAADAAKVADAYAKLGLKAIVHPFFAHMELPMGAASCAVSRAGASSLSELAAMRLPAVLVPYPAATDNHQFYNARSFVDVDAAALLEQFSATPEGLLNLLRGQVEDEALRQRMQSALAGVHAPKAAEEIAETMLAEVSRTVAAPAGGKVQTPGSDDSSGMRQWCVTGTAVTPSRAK
jgi:UDP-N-acetylglucosamine--N-acetylmuramyl-(pentapeptide) pyrophosphoryl-undecaprenol N-acetylglucosamine transferase